MSLKPPTNQVLGPWEPEWKDTWSGNKRRWILCRENNRSPFGREQMLTAGGSLRRWGSEAAAMKLAATENAKLPKTQSP